MAPLPIGTQPSSLATGSMSRRGRLIRLMIRRALRGVRARSWSWTASTRPTSFTGSTQKVGSVVADVSASADDDESRHRPLDRPLSRACTP